jgi:hypothetical protein
MGAIGTWIGTAKVPCVPGSGGGTGDFTLDPQAGCERNDSRPRRYPRADTGEKPESACRRSVWLLEHQALRGCMVHDRFARAITSPSVADVLGTPPPIRNGGSTRLVALLVALVHHRGSCSVTLSNRTGMFQSQRQRRGSVRWGVTERD